ncbi:MAG: response regulator [Desulfobulbaceae bacterium]|jgi:YesN/AraC family two-component response regulator|nr:response regulator [Desulfobulbaceae bacterium]
MSENKRHDLTILYVEDDAATRLEMEQLLNRRAETVLTAENGAIGLELFHRFNPDLVITDIRMPVMDGLQMADMIRKINPDIRIIATTAHSDTAFLLEAIEIGIDHYVLKPIDLGKFITAIEKCSRDIDAHKGLKQYHQEREHLIAELRTALGEIKTLQGILPICSFCKCIRCDEGYWEQVESYISRHSSVDFSHSICPTCLKEHYPEHYESVMDALKKDKKGDLPS